MGQHEADILPCREFGIRVFAATSRNDGLELNRNFTNADLSSPRIHFGLVSSDPWGICERAQGKPRGRSWYDRTCHPGRGPGSARNRPRTFPRAYSYQPVLPFALDGADPGDWGCKLSILGSGERS